MSEKNIKLVVSEEDTISLGRTNNPPKVPTSLKTSTPTEAKKD